MVILLVQFQSDFKFTVESSSLLHHSVVKLIYMFYHADWNPDIDQTVLYLELHQGPVVQSLVSLTSLLRVISLTVLADSVYNILIIFAEKM